jgi:hypothetical protein
MISAVMFAFDLIISGLILSTHGAFPAFVSWIAFLIYSLLIESVLTLPRSFKIFLFLFLALTLLHFHPYLASH